MDMARIGIAMDIGGIGIAMDMGAGVAYTAGTSTAGGTATILLPCPLVRPITQGPVRDAILRTAMNARGAIAMGAGAGGEARGAVMTGGPTEITRTRTGRKMVVNQQL
jgi:hypothetical protein